MTEHRLLPALAALCLASLAAFGVWWWLGRPIPLASAPHAHVPCLSYAPFRGEQSPFDESLVIPRAQIEDDLRHLAARTDCVRTYAVNQGMDAVPEIAAALGLKVMLGAWIGRVEEKNAAEVATAAELANRFPAQVVAVIIGNEVLLRREQPPERLAEIIADARARVSVPVTYADVWEFWLEHPEVARAVDFVTVHMLPYWEDQPIAVERAPAHIEAIWRRVAAAFPGKPVFIGEAGWPSAGRMREAALPSPVNQARFVREMLLLAEREQVGLNLIEAFDQPWKRRLEGTVGGAWGVFTADRQPKFPLTGPVSNDPRWLARFVSATALAALCIGFAVLCGWRRRFGGWLALAVAAQFAAGVLLTATAHALIASLTVLDRLVAYGQLFLAGASFVFVAIALAGPAREPSIRPSARLLADLARRAPPSFGDAAVRLGLIRLTTLLGAAAITLALIFDPRYRDFPTTAYLVPAAAFLVLALARPDGAPIGREDRLLAGVLALGGIAVVIREGPENLQALAWAAVVLMLAAGIGLSAWRRRASAARLHSESAQQTEQQSNRAGSGAV